MSLRSLREVTGCLVEMNQEVVRVVLASKHDVWGCADLFALVEDYFDASLHTLDFLAALDRALRRARDSQLVLHLAIQVQDPAVRHADVVDALRRFKADPFTDEFFAAFQAAYRQLLAMLDRLRRQKRRLGRRLRSVRVWRRVTGVVFATIFAAILTDKGTELCPELLLVDGRCSESKLQPFLLTLLITFFAHNRPSSTISGLMRSPKPCRRQWVIDEFVNLAMVGGTYVRFGDLDIGGPMLNSINKCSLLPMII